MANFNFVVDNSFQPFSMQEMVMPLAMYKEAFEKDEERYLELQKQAGDFEYLSRTLPEDSQARKIYENYANDLKAQAEDFSHNGLSMKNRRALTALRGRYQGEIGRLVKADEAMRERKKVMQSLSAQDPTMLYATENLNIDDYLDGKTGNEFGISGASLDTAGAQMGAAISNRMYDTAEGEGNILGGYYKDYIQKHGIQNAAGFVTTDEFRTAMMQDLKAKGVLDNLTGANLQRAIDSYVTGAMKGIVYQEQHNPQRDLGKIDAATAQQLALSRRSQDISLASQGLSYNDRTGVVTYDIDKDPSAQKAAAITKIKATGKSKSDSSSTYGNRINGRVKITWNGDYPGNDTLSKLSDEDKKAYLDNMKVESVADDEKSHPGTPMTATQLKAEHEYLYNKVADFIGRSRGSFDDYDIYVKPYKWGFFDDDEMEIELVPRHYFKKNDESEDAGETDYSSLFGAVPEE